MAAHDASIEGIVKADLCHDFAWCLEACMRDKHLESHQTNRLRHILDTFPKSSHERAVDLAMVAGDVHVMHFLCSVTVRKLRDSVGAHLPRDMHSVVVLVRVLSLGCCAKIASSGVWCHLLFQRLIYSNQFEPALVDSTIYMAIIEQVLLKNLVADRCAKYQLLKLISQIGYIWGQPHCVTLLKEYDIEYFTRAGHEDLDYFIGEYNKLCERLMPKPIENMETDHEQVPSSKPIPAVGSAQTPPPPTPLHYNPFHATTPHH
ncbi:hypothetical protein TELCIR_01551 [Teladorsagia circumcincta]|uniref:Uncharacterized protein n=1 Tax=Teladorsagia circumcincta TaxID=45464 RepID=A0A2G9V1M2_TELCI|nr:hypothetical protein TELCIR_01551 [Teladorsagia circumcincta]